MAEGEIVSYGVVGTLMIRGEALVSPIRTQAGDRTDVAEARLQVVANSSKG